MVEKLNTDTGIQYHGRISARQDRAFCAARHGIRKLCTDCSASQADAGERAELVPIAEIVVCERDHTETVRCHIVMITVFSVDSAISQLKPQVPRSVLKISPGLNKKMGPGNHTDKAVFRTRSETDADLKLKRPDIRVVLFLSGCSI